MDTLPCIIDVGTGRTKMGFAGHEIPQYIFPSFVGVKESPGKGKVGVVPKVLQDLDYAIGDDIYAHASLTQKSPMKHGIIHDYTLYEKLMSSSIYSFLGVDPTNHLFFLTEPPLNTPENREFLAELMFENFGVRGMYIGTQAVMALMASWVNRDSKDRPTTGIVVDSGHGLTHIIPIADCYAIGTAMKYVPIAGTEMTAFTQQLIRDRENGIPPESIYDVAKIIKEQHCYVCKNIVNEFDKFESTPEKILKIFKGAHPVTNKPFEFNMAYERFMTPELLFQPDLFNSEFNTSLDKLIFSSVMDCPIDVRRGLFKNIVFSGGSTCYPNLHRRVEQDLKKHVGAREQGGKLMEVVVNAHSKQMFAVFFGCSMMASTPEFKKVVHTRADYLEHGPAICRHNQLFGVLG